MTNVNVFVKLVHGYLQLRTNSSEYTIEHYQHEISKIPFLTVK